MKDIGDQVFVSCSSITEFCVDKSNKSYRSIDGNLYSKDASEFICYAYGKEDASITLPNGVERIRNVAFKNCKKLENVDIPETVSFIDVAAFRGCSNLKRIAIPRGVKYLDRWTFEGCTSLEEVTFFEGFTSIGEGVFAGCSELKDIVIPDSVEYIDYDSFDGCDQLVIHASVGSYAEEHAKEYEIPFVAIK